MRLRYLFRFIALVLTALIVASVMLAIAANNTVSSSRVTVWSTPISPNDLKPPACASLYLTTLVTGSGIINGTDGNDLILGGAGVDIINGLGGSDCILGGGDDDTLDGGDGADVCIGGAGNNTCSNCETVQ